MGASLIQQLAPSPSFPPQEWRRFPFVGSPPLADALATAMSDPTAPRQQASRSLTAFARRLAQPRPAIPAQPPAPLTPEQLAQPDAQAMIVRYGMRPATAAELAIFPTHPLLINALKARVTRIGQPIYADIGDVPLVVWAVESYPNSRQFRMPNGDLLHEQYNGIIWQPVPPDTPISSMAAIRQERVQRRWRQTVQASLRHGLTLPPTG